MMADYRQRMTCKSWAKILLQGNDRIIFKGRGYTLKAKRLGYGIVEVYKELDP